ncbi:nudix hydrolase 13, mitochondrial-like [Aristolochia californica]|uniref:nudix hydrolase 13, mitochondrial-like n=1 Tax=Aristolochia californica TaxID=171875 RepID=UPI0035D6201B
MSPLQARVGRQRQLYDQGLRLVAGCIPYRLKNVEDATASEDSFEVLMVSSPDRDDLVFPKGGWENDESVHDAARREALEEAGIKGELEDEPLGVWEFRSKSKENRCGREGYCKGYMFAMEVTEELDYWPEQGSRERRWLSISDAIKLCRYDWMREALEVFQEKVCCKYEKHQLREDSMVVPVSEATDHQIPSMCFVKTSDSPCLESPINALC